MISVEGKETLGKIRRDEILRRKEETPEQEKESLQEGAMRKGEIPRLEGNARACERKASQE